MSRYICNSFSLRCGTFWKLLKNLQIKILSLHEFEVRFHSPFHSPIILFHYLTSTDFGHNFLLFLEHFGQCLITLPHHYTKFLFKEMPSFPFKAQICMFFNGIYAKGVINNRVKNFTSITWTEKICATAGFFLVAWRRLLEALYIICASWRYR